MKQQETRFVIMMEFVMLMKVVGVLIVAVAEEMTKSQQILATAFYQGQSHTGTG